MDGEDEGLCVKKQANNQRIRIAEHPLQVHLLFTVWASLLLSHNAPASYAELMESEEWVKVNFLPNKGELQQLELINTSTNYDKIKNVLFCWMYPIYNH